MNARPINVAIVGIGRAGWGDHRKSFLARPDKFRIVAACDIIEERNQVIQEETGCRVYSCIEDLLKDEEVELVDIATRSCDHYKHARLALEAGKDVVVEKPMSIEYEEAKHLYEISNKPGMPRLFARHNRRFELVFNAFLDAINSGILGNVYEAGTGCCSFEFRDDWQTLEESVVRSSISARIRLVRRLAPQLGSSSGGSLPASSGRTRQGYLQRSEGRHRRRRC